MEKVFKQKKGITLIALVITIIVLLILAGISISMLSGDNSILRRATTAKENTEKTQIEERIKLAYHAALTGGQGSYTKDSLEKELTKEFGDEFEEVDDSNDKNWILKAGGQSVTIPAGKVYNAGKISAKVYVYTDSNSNNITWNVITITAEEGQTWKEWANDANNMDSVVMLDSFSLKDYINSTDTVDIEGETFRKLNGFIIDFFESTNVDFNPLQGNVSDTKYADIDSTISDTSIYYFMPAN